MWARGFWRLTSATATALLPAILLAGCSSKTGEDDGLSVHQRVAVSERRLEILEDARITPHLRALMWGGPKDPAALAAEPSLEPADRAVLAGGPFRRAVLRLVDSSGTVLARRRLDCELGEIAEPPLSRGDERIWAVGDDCSIGGGDYAGLITRLLDASALAGPVTRLKFESFRDAKSDERAEMTLVSASRISWHLLDQGDVRHIRELSVHPDFDSPAFKSAKSDASATDNLPLVTEFRSYRWDDASGQWVRGGALKPGATDKRAADWAPTDAFPGED